MEVMECDAQDDAQDMCPSWCRRGRDGSWIALIGLRGANCAPPLPPGPPTSLGRLWAL